MKRILFTLFMVLVCFNNVYALDGNLNVVINSTPTWPDYWTIYAGQTRNLTVDTSIHDSSKNDVFQYVRINVCASSDLSDSYVSGNFSNFKVYNTKKECNKGLRPGKGYIQYLQFNVDSWNNDGYSYTAAGDLYLNNKKGFQEDVVFTGYYGSNIDEVQQLLNNQDIINNQNNNKNDIINSQNNNTNDIINNQNNNKNDIINNQNENNDKINNNLQTCRPSYNLFNVKSDSFDNLKGITYIIKDDSIIITSGTNNVGFAYLRYTITLPAGHYWFSSVPKGGSESTYYSIVELPTGDINEYGSGNDFTLTETTTFNFYPFDFIAPNQNVSGLEFKPFITTYENRNKPFEKFGEICSSKLDDVNSSIGNLNDSINSNAGPNNLDKLNDVAGWLPPGPVDSIITLPLSLLNNINRNLSQQCVVANIPLPYVNRDIQLPCMNEVYEKMGFGTLFNSFGIVAAGWILYHYLLSLYVWVDDTLSFRENNMPGYYEDRWGGGA